MAAMSEHPEGWRIDRKWVPTVMSVDTFDALHNAALRAVPCEGDVRAYANALDALANEGLVSRPSVPGE